MIKNVKSTVPWTYVINDLKGEEIVGTFKFRVEKIIKIKFAKMYVKWIGYDSFFNSWIDKKDMVLMREYFPEPKSLGRRVKVELDLLIMQQNQI